MLGETAVSLFLSYPIGLAINTSSDKLRGISDNFKYDNIEPLKHIFIKAFIKSIDEHSKYYDEHAVKITKKLKSFIEEDKDKLIDIFSQHTMGDNILNIMQDVEYRKNVASKIAITYLLDEQNNSLVDIEAVILDCLSYYKSSFFKHMSDKEGIITLLENCFELNNEVSQIKKILQTNLEKHNFAERYDDYKKSVINNFKEINFFGLGLDGNKKRKKREIGRIYVKPDFKEVNNDYLENLSKQYNHINNHNNTRRWLLEKSDFDFAKLLTLICENRNIVILGDPGAGKSTLAKYIMYTILKKDKLDIANKAIYDLVPFRIELRKYIKEKKNNSCGILSYLKNIIESDNQININDVSELRNFFLVNNILVFFDGLDEIFDVNEKLEVKNDIENFLENYPNSKAIVTSRIIGYDEVRFDKNFTELRILSFNEKKIKEYINKWYCQDCEEIDNCFKLNGFTNIEEVAEKCPQNTKSETNELIKEIMELDDEIKTNPLLLSLIIILYQNNGQLPNSKLELYKSCTRTLVDNWDESKSGLDIKINDLLKIRKETIFSALALWQYIEMSSKSYEINVNYKSAIKQISNTIMDLDLTNDICVAEIWASEFMKYAEKRSLYFDNNFTHKTFLEYYTALRIFRKYYTEPELYDIIFRYMQNSFWFDVLELLFNMIDENQPDNTKMNNILKKVLSENKEACVFCLKIIPNIINVSKDTIKDLIKSSMLICILNAENVQIGNEHNMLSYQIANEFKGLIERNKYFKEIEESFNEIYYKLTDDNSRQNYFLFYYGVIKDVLGDIDINIEQNDELQRFVKISPQIYVENFLDTNNNRILGYPEKIIQFSSLFGKQKLLDNMALIYEGSVGRPSLLMLYMFDQFQDNNNMSCLVNNLSILLENGFDIDMLKKAGAENWISRVIENDNLSYFKIINSTDNWEIISFLLDMCEKVICEKNIINLEEIKELYKTHTYTDLIIEYIDNIYKDKKETIEEIAVTVEN